MPLGAAHRVREPRCSAGNALQSAQSDLPPASSPPCGIDCSLHKLPVSPVHSSSATPPNTHPASPPSSLLLLVTGTTSTTTPIVVGLAVLQHRHRQPVRGGHGHTPQHHTLAWCRTQQHTSLVPRPQRPCNTDCWPPRAAELSRTRGGQPPCSSCSWVGVWLHACGGAGGVQGCLVQLAAVLLQLAQVRKQQPQPQGGGGGVVPPPRSQHLQPTGNTGCRVSSMGS